MILVLYHSIYDGANLRYTGYFRDITDAKYKLFTNLLTEPTTTVDTTDPSFQYTDLILANLSATGNVAQAHTSLAMVQHSPAYQPLPAIFSMPTHLWPLPQ
jgi:hypothetical protein